MGTRTMFSVPMPCQVMEGMKDIPMPARISSRTVSGLTLSSTTDGSKPAILQKVSVMVRRLFPCWRQMNSSPATSLKFKFSRLESGLDSGRARRISSSIREAE